MIRVNIAGVRELEANLRRVDAAVQQAVRGQVVRSALNVQNGARQNVPVDTGRLRNSITHEIRDAGLTAVVGTNVAYAPYIEYGTRAHFPPVDAVAGWARRHGMEPFVAARAISRQPYPAQFFMTRAFEQERVRMPGDFARAVGAVINNVAA